MNLILTEDATNCPSCNAVLVRIDRRQRICTSCGLTATYWSFEDERERKEALKPRDRAFNEEHGITQIDKYRTRW